MFSLAFMGKESEHIEKQHVHEAPKVMLIPAAILAGLCIVWGLSEPLVASFMHVNLGEGLLAAFTNIEFPIFIVLLIPTGLIAYFTYYKGYQGIRNFAASKNPIMATFKHAYFFDDFYGAVSKGIERLLRWSYPSRKCPIRTLPRYSRLPKSAKLQNLDTPQL